jgi:hypothetical protein
MLIFHIYLIGLAVSLFLGMVLVGFQRGEELDKIIGGVMALIYSVFWPVVAVALSLFFIGYFPIWIGKCIRRMTE